MQLLNGQYFVKRVCFQSVLPPMNSSNGYIAGQTGHQQVKKAKDQIQNIVNNFVTYWDVKSLPFKRRSLYESYISSARSTGSRH